MGKPCSVCTLANRTEVDQRLMMPNVNLSQLSRDYGVSRTSLKRHEAHVADLVRRFVEEDEAYSAGSIRAQHRMLYERTLRALDRAEAGVLSHVDKDGTAHYKVSQTAIASFIREARSGLDAMAKVGASETESVEHVVNRALDDRIAGALDRMRARQANPRPVLELEGSEDDGTLA